MAQDLIPIAVQRCRPLPLLGTSAEDFVAWLAARGYRKKSLRYMLRPFPQIDRWLREHGVERLAQIGPAILSQCWKAFVRRKGQPSATVRALGQFLTARGLMQPEQP